MNEFDLVKRTCAPCTGDATPLRGEAAASLHAQLDSQWTLVADHHLERIFSFPDFREALTFVNRVGEIAEQQGHHPNIQLTWGSVTVTIWTHAIDGLTENDFILAAKTDEV